MTSSITVRRMRESDVEVADRLLQASFERSASFEAHVRLSLAIQPDGVLVAEQDGQVVGTVGAVDYGRLAYIGLMAVEPSRQGRGIGRMLMEHLLHRLDERMCPMALLDATEQGARLYETMGFVDDATAVVFERASEKEGALVAAPPVAQGDSNVCFAVADDLAEISAFDAQHFGADRSKLLAALWPEHGARCVVARAGSDRLTGFLFARDPVLGPWLADSPDVAENLLIRALALEFANPPHVMVPRSNALATQLLSRHGFGERRRLRHMRRGGDGPPGATECLFGQSSFAHG